MILVPLISSLVKYIDLFKFVNKYKNKIPIGNINTNLLINNSYGNITFNNWEKKEISIDVIITLYTDNEAESQKYLENADVILTQDSGNISYTTAIKYDNLDNSFKKSNSKFQVNYVINHPVYLKVNISNSYGDISFNEISGKSNINLNYGKLKAKNFAFDDSKPVSEVNLNYAKAEIEKCTWSKMNVEYSTLIINKNTAIELNSSYSHVWINNSYGIFAKSIYDDYKMKNCKKSDLNASYTATNIDTIEINANLNLNYGSFNTKTIYPAFENLTINSNYTKVKAIISDNACYQIDATLNYGQIEFSPKANIERRVKNSQTTVKGNIGCTQPQSTVTIKGNYCDINLF